jgi:hypothetical protein
MERDRETAILAAIIFSGADHHAASAGRTVHNAVSVALRIQLEVARRWGTEFEYANVPWRKEADPSGPEEGDPATGGIVDAL